jgi:fermentation-respiration switch protein FrsA (DUF1100 family)
MKEQRWWMTGIVTAMSVLGTAAIGSIVALAAHFVEELSRPHVLLDDSAFTWKLPETSGEPPRELQRSLLFSTRDGKLLRGDFWAQQHPAPTVIICHGYRVYRSMLYPVAALEYTFGYNILLFDFRGHGASESVTTSGGNAEIRDLEAAIAAASQQQESLPGKIIIHGFSMGASIALLTLPHPDVIAVIADSPYARLDDFLRHFVHWKLTQDSRAWSPPLHPLRGTFHSIAWATVMASRAVFRLRFGHALIAHPARSLQRWRKKRVAAAPPLLLIHGTDDELIPLSHAHRIAREARAHSIPLDTYFAEGSNHCGAYGDHPEEYVQVIQRFLAGHLGADFPGKPAE